MADLPDSWDDEPWPLEDPVPTRAESFNPRSWSDTHDPDVLELDADEVWDYAVDHGISYEQAGVILQRQQVAEQDVIQWKEHWHTSPRRPTGVTVDDINRLADQYFGQIYASPPVQHQPIPTGDPVISRIWSEIMSDQPRIIRPGDPDFGF